MSIKDAIKAIEGSKIYLPALQRKFVWGKHQIQMLFDSLMRNYPIGTFLFWRLQKEKADTYVFYEFLKEYDERNPYNVRKTGSFLEPEIIGVLDGQQRLSSMYIGLQGTHTEKALYQRANNSRAYKKTMLYLNLLSLPYIINEDNEIETDEEKNFEFRFLTEESSKTQISRKIKSIDEEDKDIESEETMFWFRVGDILLWNEDPEFDIIIDKFIETSSNENQKKELSQKRRFIRKCLTTLKDRISKDKLINYFDVSKDDLEDILKIFIRVNSGGTQLNKTDLLFSTIVATWENGREEIEELLKHINTKGGRFNFSNEFLMRCCLVLSDAPVLYKVNSFKSENVQKIKDEWRKISDAVLRMVDLLVEFGFSSNTLTSQNATIIIAYYIMKGGEVNKDIKQDIKKYLIHALLNGIYGSTQEQVIAAFRNAFREETLKNGKKTYKLKIRKFEFDELLKIKLPSRKTLYVRDVDIENFLTYKISASSFLVLSLLYPNLKYSEVQFHQDHIHPYAHFSKQKFRDMEIPEDQWQTWLLYRDMIPNIQLLEGRQNESKNATEFKKWFEKKSKDEQAQFCISNYIPTDVDYGFASFIEFFENRKSKLRDELKRVLAINNEIQVPGEEDLEAIEDVDDEVRVKEMVG